MDCFIRKPPAPRAVCVPREILPAPSRPHWGEEPRRRGPGGGDSGPGQSGPSRVTNVSVWVTLGHLHGGQIREPPAHCFLCFCSRLSSPHPRNPGKPATPPARSRVRPSPPGTVLRRRPGGCRPALGLWLRLPPGVGDSCRGAGGVRCWRRGRPGCTEVRARGLGAVRPGGAGPEREGPAPDRGRAARAASLHSEAREPG